MSNEDCTKYMRFKSGDLQDEIVAVRVEEYGDSGVVIRLEVEPCAYRDWPSYPGTVHYVFKDGDGLPEMWDHLEECDASGDREDDPK